jgi:predicted GIY-YIG superfamily endonuclease
MARRARLRRLQWFCSMYGEKRFVYILESLASRQPYVGVTSNMSARLLTHNAGGCPHTSRNKPWRLVVVIEFADEATAIKFERYLKSGSGRAFAKRHVGDQSLKP